MLRWMLNSADQPWGDYGDLLAYGMTAHLSRNSRGWVRLEHTGPFIPPVFLTGIADLLVTDDARQRLEGSGLGGFTFAPVELARIVRLDWRSWDLTADDPAFYPDSGEPEDYVLSLEHDPVLAQSIGPVWEVKLNSYREAPEADFARALPDAYSVVASDAGVEWVRRMASDWVVARPFNPR